MLVLQMSPDEAKDIEKTLTPAALERATVAVAASPACRMLCEAFILERVNKLPVSPCIKLMHVLRDAAQRCALGHDTEAAVPLVDTRPPPFDVPMPSDPRSLNSSPVRNVPAGGIAQPMPPLRNPSSCVSASMLSEWSDGGGSGSGAFVPPHHALAASLASRLSAAATAPPATAARTRPGGPSGGAPGGRSGGAASPGAARRRPQVLLDDDLWTASEELLFAGACGSASPHGPRQLAQQRLRRVSSGLRFAGTTRPCTTFPAILAVTTCMISSRSHGFCSF